MLIGLAITMAIIMAPSPAGLSPAAQRVIAVMTFVVPMWITEAIPYGVSVVALDPAGRVATIQYLAR